jgi:hypothetical protein
MKHIITAAAAAGTAVLVLGACGNSLSSAQKATCNSLFSAARNDYLEASAFESEADQLTVAGTLIARIDLGQVRQYTQAGRVALHQMTVRGCPGGSTTYPLP